MANEILREGAVNGATPPCGVYGNLCVAGCRLVITMVHERDKGGSIGDPNGDKWYRQGWLAYSERSRDLARDGNCAHREQLARTITESTRIPEQAGRFLD